MRTIQEKNHWLQQLKDNSHEIWWRKSHPVVLEGLTATTCTPNSNTLYLVEGSNFKGLNIKRHNYYASMKIDNLRGHPDFKNNKAKVDWLTFEKENGKAITMQMNLFWRLNHCDVGGKWYGADVCA